jgi:hypothetical protein
VLNDFNLDGHVNGSFYCVSSNEFFDGRKSDVLYIPKTNKPMETALLIIVEMQHTIDLNFIKRVNRYCLNVHMYNFLPKVIVSSIKGYSSKAFMNSFTKEEGCHFFTMQNQCWANSIQLYSLDSISPLVTEGKAMTLIVALLYFLSSQQRSIVSLDESDDEELKNFYKIAYKSFLQYTTIENTSTYLANDVLEKTSKHFEKIANCASESSETSLKKIQACAKNGLEFT